MAIDSDVGKMRMGNKRALALFIGAVVLAGHISPDRAAAAGKPVNAAARPSGTMPQTPLPFFDGRARSTGTITTLFVSTASFTATFEGEYDQGALKLDERFTFEDGKALQRWDLFAHRDGSISGTVSTQLEDGTMAELRAVAGEYGPGRVVLEYDGYAPNGSETLFHFNHVMRPREDGTVTNDVTISKYFFPLATSDVTFIKPSR